MTPWILRPRDRTEGVEWTLAVSLALDNPDGEKLPDQIWWETNDVAAPAFLLIAGYARFGTLDWAGQGGVREYGELEDALDTVMYHLEGGDLQGTEDRVLRERPWLTIDQFLNEAQDVRLERSGLEQVQVRARDAAFARELIGERVAAALLKCTQRVSTTESFLRIWLGAPNLRIHLAVPIDDEPQRAIVVHDVVELGVALARSAGRRRH